MKHSIHVTILLLSMFLVSQLIGLYALSTFMVPASGEEIRDLPTGIERPDIEPSTTPWLLVGGILIGTGLIFLLMRFKLGKVWNAWFFIAVFILSYIGLSAFLPALLALLVAVIFAFLKYFGDRIHFALANLPELFIYAGFAIIFSPMLTLMGAFILLLLISAYDAFAVWKSKHMISLATFQMDSGRFAGANIPYRQDGKTLSGSKHGPGKKVKVRRAILGGGDFAFPLIFSGVVLLTAGWFPALMTTFGAALGLATIFVLGDEKKFYPAMPFITAGILIGALALL